MRRLAAFKRKLFPPGLLDDLFQQIDVVDKGFTPGGSERTGGEGTVILVGFTHRNIARLLQRADVRGDVSVCHIERVTENRKNAA